jgi:hypothetical protein
VTRVRALLIVAFLAYVAVDLGCPLIPGAFSFDPASSVDAASPYRARPLALPVSVAPPSFLLTVPAGRGVDAKAETAGVPPPVAWRPHAIRDHVAAPDPSRSFDDD